MVTWPARLDTERHYLPTKVVPVTYSTDVTCLSWVWRESSILWGVEGGTSGGGAVLYIYGDPVWRSFGGEEAGEELREEA